MNVLHKAQRLYELQQHKLLWINNKNTVCLCQISSLYSHFNKAHFVSIVQVPGLLKLRVIGQNTLGSAAIFGLFLGAGSLIHCGKSY
jgi:DNA-binding transcriptional regulator WhiA